MIRPFALADSLLVYSLQRSDTPLAIEHILTHPRPPLWLALTAPWPWAGAGVATYVTRGRGEGQNGGMSGFVQLLKRQARPEADLLHLAPALPAHPDCDCREEAAASAEPATAAGPADPAPVWRQLLAYCCEEAARYGIERVYVSIPDGGPEHTCLGEASFRLYTRETVYRLAALTETGMEPAGYRRQRPQDSWALQRLYTRTTPLLVQQAEGALTGRAGSPRLTWWEPERWRGLVWMPAGEVRGAVQVHVGRAGHWLRVLGANALTTREIRGLVEGGLRILAPHSRNWRGETIPVYATVRDYDAGLSAALTGFGFAPFTDRARFVRHTLGTSLRRVTAAIPVPEGVRNVAVR